MSSKVPASAPACSRSRPPRTTAPSRSSLALKPHPTLAPRPRRRPAAGRGRARPGAGRRGIRGAAGGRRRRRPLGHARLGRQPPALGAVEACGAGAPAPSRAGGPRTHGARRAGPAHVQARSAQGLCLHLTLTYLTYPKPYSRFRRPAAPHAQAALRALPRRSCGAAGAAGRRRGGGVVAPRGPPHCAAVALLPCTTCPCRYERELARGQRPVLKKVLEQDEPAGRCMVLCLAAELPSAPGTGALPSCRAECLSATTCRYLSAARERCSSRAAALAGVLQNSVCHPKCLHTMHTWGTDPTGAVSDALERAAGVRAGAQPHVPGDRAGSAAAPRAPQRQGQGRGRGRGPVPAGDPAHVELTDGWYGVRAVLDAPLTALLAAGRLQPGAGVRLEQCRVQS